MKKETKGENEVIPTWKKVVNIVIDVLLVICIFIGVFSALSAFQAKKNQVPTMLGLNILSIQTNSMEPTIDVGDMVIGVKVKDASTLKAGDIITFWTIISGERVLNTHRIEEVTTNIDGDLLFVTKGDNPSATTDATKTRVGDIVCKYAFHIPKLGAIYDWLQTSLGFGIVIVGPIAIFFIYELIKFFKTLFAYQAEKTRVAYASEMNGGLSEVEQLRAELQALKKAQEDAVKTQNNQPDNSSSSSNVEDNKETKVEEVKNENNEETK